VRTRLWRAFPANKEIYRELGGNQSFRPGSVAKSRRYASVLAANSPLARTGKFERMNREMEHWFSER
jgi:hypothetical protein